MTDWASLHIAVVAGDEREREIARLAAATGARVRGFGFPWPADGIEGVEHAATADEALEGADYAFFPIPGIAADGSLFAPDHPDPIVPTPEHARRHGAGRRDRPGRRGREPAGRSRAAQGSSSTSTSTTAS